MPVAAFKMGMLGSTEIVTVVAEVVSDYPDVPWSRPGARLRPGDEFASDDMVSAIRELLVPQSTVVTPNIPELRRSPTTTTAKRASPSARSACSTPAASTCW
jgi:hydroxymethylpyrimidine/phosphomethylpyrimidine kinase